MPRSLESKRNQLSHFKEYYVNVVKKNPNLLSVRRLSACITRRKNAIKKHEEYIKLHKEKIVCLRKQQYDLIKQR